MEDKTYHGMTKQPGAEGKNTTATWPLLHRHAHVSTAAVAKEAQRDSLPNEVFLFCSKATKLDEDCSRIAKLFAVKMTSLL